MEPVNTPTLLNAAFGRHKTFAVAASSLVKQVRLPLIDAEEMGSSGLEMQPSMADLVVEVDAKYSSDFIAQFGTSGATEETRSEALAIYMASLFAGPSPFASNQQTEDQA